MKNIIFTCLLLFIGTVSAETVYKTVDEDGNIIFSDQPSAEAEEIKLQKLQTIKNPNPAEYKPGAKQTTAQEQQPFYQALSVVSPAGGEAVRSNAGDLSIQLSLQPQLRRGHKVIIKMDGKVISSGTALSASLQNVDRGDHSLSATVMDGKGKSLITTSSSFTMLRVALGNKPAP